MPPSAPTPFHGPHQSNLELVSFTLLSLPLPPTHPPQTPTPPAATAAKSKTVKGAKITDLDADEAGGKLAALSVTEVGVGKRKREIARERAPSRRGDETRRVKTCRFPPFL